MFSEHSLSTCLTSGAVLGARKPPRSYTYCFSVLKCLPLLSTLTHVAKHIRPVLLKLFLIPSAHPTPFWCHLGSVHITLQMHLSCWTAMHLCSWGFDPRPRLLEHREQASTSAGSSASCSVLNKQSVVTWVIHLSTVCQYCWLAFSSSFWRGRQQSPQRNPPLSLDYIRPRLRNKCSLPKNTYLNFPTTSM